MRVALLTGGGDCPGLNAVIYAAVRKGINHYGDEFIGFLNGWRAFSITTSSPSRSKTSTASS
jgi:6-phosphofructokinase